MIFSRMRRINKEAYLWITKIFFDGMFDFNGDGKTDLMEEGLAYIVNYVSEDRYNDWSEYFSLALMLREHFNGGTYILNHIKTPDGYYATINDFYNRKK